MTSAEFGQRTLARPSAGMLLILFLCAVILPNIPVLNILLAPLGALTTMIHEMGHAVACVLTGGSVQGMTIVPDGQGHGGLTFSRGGIPFIYSQTGYLGTTLAGCALIALGRFPQWSKGILFTLGAVFGIASLTFMFGTVLHGGIMQGLGSMLIGLAMAAGFIWVSLKVNVRFANLLLLFIGIQVGMNAINDVTFLVSQSFGFGFAPVAWSDATNMAKMTGIPSFFWAILWSALSVGMLAMTILWTYGSDKKR